MIDAAEEEHMAPPVLRQNTDEVLKEILGYSDAKIKKLKEEEVTPEGVRPRIHRRI